MKNIKKILQKIFKSFTANIFSLFHGRIKGKILADQDPRVKIKKVTKEKKINYKVFSVNNGRLYTDTVHDTALILDNFIVDGPSYQLRPINNVIVEENIVFKKGTPRRKIKLNGKILSLLTGGAGNDNYFHWMYDVLPRIGLCEEIFDISKIDYFLLPSLEKSFQNETLDMLKIPESKRLSSKIYRHIVGSEIIVTEHPYCIKNDASNDIQNIPIWISQWLKKKYLHKKDDNLKTGKKIYIDRSDTKSNMGNLRSIINEEEVKEFLNTQGFETLTLGNFSFSGQVKIMNNADIIVGLHGAAFGSFCFCQPNTKIIEFKSKTAGKMYENLAKTNNLIYKVISCKPEGLDSKNQYGNIKIPIDELKKTIEAF